MRKIIGLCVIASMFMSSVMWSAPALSAPLTMGQIYNYAKQGNIKALKSLGSRVDAVGKDGNTNLCRAVYKNDYKTFNALRVAGASAKHPCTQRIPPKQIKAFNEGYVTWAKETNAKIAAASATKGSTPTSAETIATETGLSTTAMVGMGVGAAALIGGGIALAAGGGGGGGGHSSKVCSGHGTKTSDGSCVCDEGWTEADCDTPNPACTGDKTPVTHCMNKAICKHGDETLHTCTTCQMGWVLSGNTCVADTCDGYNLTKCPPNATGCSECKSGEMTKYKVNGCVEGWTGESCSTPAACEYTTISCGQGYHETGETCKSGDNIYKKCEANTCEGSTTTVAHCSNQETTCWSGSTPYYTCHDCAEGWTLSGNTCVENDCSGYQTSCGAGYHKASETPACVSGTTNYFTCVENDCSAYETICGTGYHKASETPACVSGATNYFTCVENDCSAYEANCGTGYHKASETPACMSGTTPYYECVADACEGYELTSCPANATSCSPCQSGETTKYKVSGCVEGWTGESCSTPKTCEYTTTSCGQGYHETGETCKSGNNIYKKCEANTCEGSTTTVAHCSNQETTCWSGSTPYYTCHDCAEGWTLSGNTCVENDCSGYQTSCGAGYHKASETPACMGGTIPYYECVPDTCEGYNLTKCPPNATGCSECQSGETTKYKVSGCDEGWTGESCSTPKTCEYTTTSCGQGYHETGETCKSGNNIYKKCEANTCEGSTTTVAHCSNQETTCWSGSTPYYTCHDCAEGWTLSDNACMPNACPGYQESCAAGYHETGNTCQSGTDTLVECEANTCNSETYPRMSPPQNCTQYGECISPTEHRYTVCQQCNTNTVWADGECITVKTPCPPGFYCPEDGCPAGYWCPGGSKPIACPAGHYCPGGGDSPISCPAGSYCPGGGGSGGSGSGGGWGGYSLGGGGTVSPILCPEGYYCGGGTSTPTECPANTKCDEGGGTVTPTPCADNEYCPPKTCLPIICGPTGSNWKGSWPTGCYLECVHGTFNPNLGTRGECVCDENQGWEGEICDIAHNCGPDYSKTCAEGYDPTGETCMSGGEALNECAPHDCGAGYPYPDECPEGYADSGDTCLSGTHIMHSCDICAEGYGKKNGVCVKYAEGFYTAVPDDKVVNGVYAEQDFSHTFNSDDIPDLYQDVYGVKLDITQTHLRGKLTLINNSDSNIYGIYNEGHSYNTIHNVCSADNTLIIHNNGDGNVWGEYAPSITSNGSGVSTVEITNTGNGNVTGYYGSITEATNARGGAATLDITNTGDGDVTGMYAKTTVTNSQHANGGTITIENTGSGDVYGLKSDTGNAYNTTNGTGELTVTNTSEATETGSVIAISSNGAVYNSNGSGSGNITLNNTGDGDVYGLKSDTSTAYNAGSSGTASITITNIGDGDVTGMSAKTEIRNSNGTNGGTLTIENTGDGDVYGLKSDTGYAYNTTSGNGVLNITNEGIGTVTGVLSTNSAAYNANTGSGKSGTITIDNTGDGDVYGLKSDTIYAYNAASGTGHLSIVNEGNGDVTGVFGQTQACNACGGSGNSTVTIENTGTGSIYGLRSGTGNVYNNYNGSGLPTLSIKQLNNAGGNVYGLYGNGTGSANNSFGSSLSSYGTINILNNGIGTAYGLYSETGNVSNGYFDRMNIQNTHTGSVTGMYAGASKTIINNGDIAINNLQSGTVYGLYGGTNTTINNGGDITITKNSYKDDKGTTDTSDDTTYAYTLFKGKLYGIYGDSGSNITNSGTITITGGERAYGIYHEGNGGSITNTGTIDIYSSGTSYGIFVKNGTGVTVTNTGTIRVYFEECTECSGTISENIDPYIILNGSTYLNANMMSAQSMNTNLLGGNLVAAPTAKFDITNEFSGPLGISSELTTEGFDTTYVAEDMINAGDTSGLNLISGSALFDASLADNGHDVVMTMKGFDTTTKNNSLAEFLTRNYVAGNNEAFFNKLKSIGDKRSLTASLDKMTGKEMLSRFNFEDMTMMRELNFAMNEKLFHSKDRVFELSGSVTPMAFRGDNGSNARYGLYNRREGQWLFSLGIAFTNVRSDNAHDDDDRRDTMYQLVVPIGYRTHGFNLITSPRIGYARGKYDRTGFDNKNYDGTIEKRVYGLMNEARYPLAFGDWTVEPAAEFNILGYTQRGHEDKEDYSLRIKSQNTYSVEGGIGLYLTKAKELSRDSRIKLTAGMAAYHEFADPYELDVGMTGMDGTFTLKDENRSDNRGVLRLGFDYDWSDYTLYGSIMSYIDREWRTTAKSGFKWRF